MIEKLKAIHAQLGELISSMEGQEKPEVEEQADEGNFEQAAKKKMLFKAMSEDGE